MYKWTEKYLLGNRFGGIEVEIRAEQTVFHIVILKRNAQQLSVEHISREVKSVNELPLNLLKDIPVSIVFTGKGILYRAIQADPDAGPDILLRKILPNVNADEFFVSSRKSGSAHFVSLSRQSVVLPVLSELKQQFSSVSFDIGVQCIADIRKLLAESTVVSCGNHVIAFEDESIVSAEYQQHPADSSDELFTIGDENLPGAALVAFAIGLRTASGNTFSLEQEMRSDILERRLFRFTLRAALIFVLGVLVVNYFVFSHYWNLQRELEAKRDAEGTSVSEVNLLRQQVESRTNFLQNAGLMDNSSFAWYADQLAHAMPEGIRLSQMNFSPRIKLIEEDSIGFRTSTIEICGNCEESVTLNRWIQLLKGEEWISSASIRSYEQGKTDLTGKFILDLQLQ